jgi:hypothetical protein
LTYLVIFIVCHVAVAAALHVDLKKQVISYGRKRSQAQEMTAGMIHCSDRRRGGAHF